MTGLAPIAWFQTRSSTPAAASTGGEPLAEHVGEGLLEEVVVRGGDRGAHRGHGEHAVALAAALGLGERAQELPPRPLALAGLQLLAHPKVHRGKK
eukprot:CAMPEP_0206381330 /NCGR_PEP_ID=MMETSP0294-20121207/12584_1 /ASSEMBLY_ACC=CAM_ASM_000327 /TAXON_ID=39354 /ORGANISM="Heterosigma akashiwo, Strain CCMP2393" /LENGTH=95 /DNA_ID=CAMNT_0053830767 /DNA_START=1510 /DNA_END=1795 /DNA_ORIENTATION=-